MTALLTKDQIADKITASALLVSLQLGSYNPVKTDRSESQKVCSSHGINDPNAKVMKVSKNTLPTAGVIKEIESLDNKLRALVDKSTAPFARGIGLIPSIKVFELRDQVNLLLDERELLVKKLSDEYTLYLDEAKRMLNGAFKSEDYPPVSAVVSRFYGKLDIFQIANPKDSRFDVLGSVADQLQSAVTDTLNDKLETVTPFLFELLVKPLTHMSSVLQNPEHKLAQSTFENALDAAKQAEGLNLLDNDQIRNAVYEIKSCLDQDKDMVKDNDALRARVLSDCNRILQSLDAAIPAPAVHKPRAGKKSKGKEFSETDPSPSPSSSASIEESPFVTGIPIVGKSSIVAEVAALTGVQSVDVTLQSESPITDEQIDATADKADETFNPDAMLAKLGW